MGGKAKHGADGGIDFDTVLKYIGQCGVWQWRNFFLLWFASGAAGLAVVVWSFSAYTPDYRCGVPYCDPQNPDGSPKEAAVFEAEHFQKTKTGSACSFYDFVDYETPGKLPSCGEYIGLLNSIKNNETDNYRVRECSPVNLIYDQSVVKSSLTVDYGLVCGQAPYKNIVGASYMLGMLIGSILLGWISDRFGRLPTLMLAVVLMSGSGLIGAFLPDPISFAFFRILTGMGGMGSFMISFVLAVEYVGAKFTMLIGIAIEIPFALGEALFGVEAYLIRDWSHLQLVAYVPLAACLLLWFVIPESPRWLLAVGKKEKALKIINEAARVNGRTIPEEVLKPKAAETNGYTANIEDSSTEERKPNVLDLLTPRVIFLRTINMMFQWLSVTMCFYGLTFSSTSLIGDPYSNFILICLIEIPSHFFCIFVMDCWGRKPILSFCQLISGVSVIIAGLLFEIPGSGSAVLQTFFTLLGKFCASASFAIVFVYTAELYPTIIRSTAVGACSMVARVGGILALIIGLAKDLWLPLPMLIMGCTAVTAGCLAVFFPETVGNPLPETMEEAIAIGSDEEDGEGGRKANPCKSLFQWDCSRQNLKLNVYE